MHAGRKRLNISTEDCQLVLEEDGTKIDEEVDIMELAGSIFILLAKGQRWSSVVATSASVPQPESTKPPASSEHPQSPLENTSKTFHKEMYI